MIKGIGFIFAFIVAALIVTCPAFSQEKGLLRGAEEILTRDAEEGWMYDSAIAEAKAGNYAFSYLQLHSLVEDYPQSRHLENALFTLGEYSYRDNNVAGAADNFSELLEKFPDSQSTVFAMAYLLKIAQARQATDLAVSLEKAVATFHKLSLVFRNSKEFTYRSVSQSRYKAVYYIDKVEFFKDDELFAQVSY